MYEKVKDKRQLVRKRKKEGVLPGTEGKNKPDVIQQLMMWEISNVLCTALFYKKSYKRIHTDRRVRKTVLGNVRCGET